MISFDNTEYAFAYKSDKELKRAHFLFSCMGKQWLVNLGTKLTPWAVKWNLPFVKPIVRNTIFAQFVGGETLEETAIVAGRLEQFGVQVILDYGVEGKEGEDNFDHACAEFMRVIHYAGTQHNIPFISIKVTGFARFALLEKLDASMTAATGTLMQRYASAIESVDKNSEEEWQRVIERMKKICYAASEKKIGVLVDAEESWIQQPVDVLTVIMMEKLNKNYICVYNTFQLYRHDRLQFLKDAYKHATEGNFILGAKLVRGAYMEKERKRASEMNYVSPIQSDKPSTDRDFDAAVAFCIKHLENIALIVASHNEQSNLIAAKLLRQLNIPLDHPHVHFSQLYGMSDNITFNLAKEGCKVSKYLPFGPIKDVVPYLMRRAQENSSVSGQTGRELALIKKEIRRRGL